MKEERKKKSCFELFGYDFIVDATNLSTWLIEVNTNPCLEESSKLLESYIPRMIDDIFKLTLDQSFPKRKIKSDNSSSSKQSPLSVEGYADSESIWEKILDLNEIENPKTQKVINPIL